MVSVVRLVVPRLLVAAQLESVKFKGEEDEVALRVEGLEDGEIESGESASSDKEEDGDGEDEGDEISTGSPQSGHDGHESDQESEKAEVQAKRPSKMRILELKAEGMAESLANDYPAKLPHDFY